MKAVMDKKTAKTIADEIYKEMDFGEESGYYYLTEDEEGNDAAITIEKMKSEEDGKTYYSIYVSADDDSEWISTDTLDPQELADTIMRITDDFCPGSGDKMCITSTTEIPIYVDSLYMLLHGKVNIMAEIENQIEQGDPCLDDFRDDILSEAENRGLDINKVEEYYDSDDVSTLMGYISYEESQIEFDYSEASAADDRRLSVFRIPITFDVNRYVNDKEMEYGNKCRTEYSVLSKAVKTLCSYCEGAESCDKCKVNELLEKITKHKESD